MLPSNRRWGVVHSFKHLSYMRLADALVTVSFCIPHACITSMSFNWFTSRLCTWLYECIIKQEAQLSLTNRAMLVCKVIEVWQDFLSDYVDKKFTYICYRRLIRHEWIYYGSKNCVIFTTVTKSPFSRTTAHNFCLPWWRPCDYYAICSMNGKTIQCLPNASQRVPIYLQ